MGSIATIEGISAKQATKLRKAGIRTTEALLKRGEGRPGRNEISNNTGIEPKTILEWVNRADLMRVKGVGEEYSDLLEAAGVDTVRELRNRRAANLLKRMIDVNRKRKLVRRLPTAAMVEKWVAQAGHLSPIVRH